MSIICRCSLIFLLTFSSGQKTLRLMTFNTWNSGENVQNGMQKIANHILAVNPDIVAVIEVQTNSSLPQLLNLLGPQWSGKFVNVSHPDTGIVTRHRIIPTNETTALNLRYNGGTRAIIEINFSDGSSTVVSFWAIHLAYQTFGPYVACQKLVSDPIQLYAAEACLGAGVPGRIQNMHTIISDIYFQSDMASIDQRPMFVMGDFNSPSPLDWTLETAPSHCNWTFEWPAQQELILSGFIDAFRKVHPDPKADPGITWSTVQKYSDDWQGIIPEPQDRIDIMFYKTAQWIPTSAKVYAGTEPIVPKPYYYFNDWPSDHYSVYTDFAFKV